MFTSTVALAINYYFILIEYIVGHQLQYLTNLLASGILAKVENQVKGAFKRLAKVGLFHIDLHPRNIIVDLCMGNCVNN